MGDRMQWKIGNTRRLWVVATRNEATMAAPVVEKGFNINAAHHDYLGKVISAVKTRCPPDDAPKFRMVLPPPNVTGHLHLGHALTITVEDVVARQKRLQGYKVEWIPGFDHAGIATQSVVERELWKKEGLRRVDLPGRSFLDKCHTFSSKNSKVIRNQLKLMGATLDWSKEYYTMDSVFSTAVHEAFSRLHNDGLINEGERFIHWCPKLQTTLSDQEVDRVPAGQLSIPDRFGGKRRVDAGHMVTVAYGGHGGKWNIVVGTTRPETCFADVGLAVHPEDSRYSHLIGEMVQHPLLDKRIPVVADTAVIREKGTGIVKLTPSHDQLDWQICQRNSSIFQHYSTGKCIDEKGMMCTGIAEFDALDRFEARKKVIEILSSVRRGGKVMDFPGAQVLVCSRSGDIIEPRLMRQWYLDTIPLHHHALKAIQEGKIKIQPTGQKQRLVDWLSNVEPWCLSRQLEWGHRIPAYKMRNKGTAAENSDWHIAHSAELAARYFGCKESDLVAETDVLDTWFSSALVPLVTAGWCRDSTQMDPTRFTEPMIDLMETGHDIIGFWVARMIALTIHLTMGTVPFHRVFLHGLVRDAEGRKMSKSLGNVIDPLDVIGGISLEKMLQRLEESNLDAAEIAVAQQNMKTAFPNGLPRAGTDALRFALLRHDLGAADVPIAISQLIDEGLKFSNKLWNMATYVDIISKAAPPEDASAVDLDDCQNETDKWLLSRYHRTLDTVAESIDRMELNQAFQRLHEFLLADLCDVYLETTKSALRSGDKKRLAEIRATFSHVIPGVLAQLSVFMPFASEVIYEQAATVTHRQSIHAIILKSDPTRLDPVAESKMASTMGIVKSLRSLREVFQFARDKKTPGTLFYDSTENTPKIMPEVVESLCGFKPVFAEMDGSKNDIVPFTVPHLPGNFAIKIQAEKQASYVGLLKERLAKSDERVEKQRALLDRFRQIARTNGANEKVRADRKAKDAKLVQNAEAKLQILEEEVKKMRAQLYS